MKKINIKRLLGIVILLAFFFSFSNRKIVAAPNDKKSELRAVWITPVTGDIKNYTTEAAFKSEMNGILDMLESYNMNAIIYHIRTHNNALYRSKINPTHSAFAQVNFDVFDPLAWLIDETHARGMEFHAWLNPYRLSTANITYPAGNPARNPNNILQNPSNSALKILDPGRPEVRDFLNETIKEIIEGYDVDAIHFDDYFYTNLGTNGGNIITEPDQNTFLNYRGSYPNTNAGKADWRREQVNLMIEQLSNTIKAHNKENDKYVQFGISPTGIYKNGDGNVTYDEKGHPITNGSNTRGQTHYSSYLYADSLKWVTEGWLDYILPQSYWATDHPLASYYEVMGWWDKVVKNLDVNLYSGIGLYMSVSDSNTYSWKTDRNQMKTQLNHLNTLENVSGTSIFTLNHVDKAYRGTNSVLKAILDNAYNNNWSNKTVLPVLKSMDPVSVGKVNNFNHFNGKLTWDELDNAKSYYIYRSTNNLTFNNDEIIGIVGANAELSFNTNDLEGRYQYGIKALSKTNHLGPEVSLTSDLNMSEEVKVEYKNNSFYGLTFKAKIREGLNYDANGFYVVYGKTTISELEALISNDEIIINNKKVFKKYINGVDASGDYSVTVTNLKEDAYTAEMTIIPFYETENRTVLSNKGKTVSLAEVILSLNNYSNNDLALLNLFKDSLYKVGFNVYGELELIQGLYESDYNNLKTEFIKDWNKKFNLNWTDLDLIEFTTNAKEGLTEAMSSNTNISNSNIYKFFKDSLYGDKWKFLIEFLKEIDNTVHTNRQGVALLGDGTNAGLVLWNAHHIIHSLYNFFNESHEVGGYTAIDFTDTAKYERLNEFTNTVIMKMGEYEFYNENTTIKLPKAPKVLGKTFKHYTDGTNIYLENSDFTLNRSVKLALVYS